ncbi:MAG: DUF2059 domain-containing protein [Alphaproteobacteria bacterium]|nr:DUF2059 domain-containing protein [Alphaproteobacteria bacterium]
MKFARTLKTFMLAAFTAAGLAALAPAVYAQAPAKPAAAPAKPSAAHVALAREMVELSGIALTFNAFVPQIAQQILEGFSRTRPEIRKQLEATLTELIPEYNKRTSEMVDSTATLFANSMSEADIKATVDFFKTESGKKYLEMQPRVIDQMVVSLDAWNSKLQQEMFVRVRAEMKKKGIDM